MRRFIGISSFALFLIFLSSDLSQASYDYSTGRWLQRDPLSVNPAGGKENPFKVLEQYKDGLSLYEYVKSCPLEFLDSYGTDKSKLCPGGPRRPVDPKSCPCKRRSLAQCCTSVKPKSSDAVGGYVICCDGKKITCSYITPGGIGDTSPEVRRALKLVEDCNLEHETVHCGQTADCSSSCSSYPQGSEFPFGHEIGECEAYRKSLKCLIASKSRCGSNITCQLTIEDYIELHRAKVKQYCGTEE